MSIAATHAAKAGFRKSFGRGPSRVLSFFLLALSGCASALSPTRESGIDAKYEWSRTLGERGLSGARAGNDAPGSPAVRFYQRALSDLLGSDCKYYPSDSAHAQMMFRQCGPGVSVAHAMARFFDEPNAPYLGYPVVPMGDVQYFKRLKASCAWND